MISTFVDGCPGYVLMMLTPIQFEVSWGEGCYFSDVPDFPLMDS